MRHSKFLLGASVFALLSSASAAQAALVISSDATNNVTCDAGVCMATAKNAVLNVTDLGNLIAASAVTIQSGGEAQDIVFNAPFSWTSSNGLTLDANLSIKVKKPVSDAGPAPLTLSNGGKGGELSFGPTGAISFLSTENSLTIDGHSYLLVSDIKTLAAKIHSNPSGYYALASDYDAGPDGTYNTSPISSIFSGTFEGLGNKVENLKIDDPNFEYVGLFAELDKGQIRNIGVVATNINSTNKEGGLSYAVGALLGYDNGTVNRSYSTGTVSGFTGNVGGLIGFVSRRGKVYHSHSSVSVSFGKAGNAADGAGLIGWNYGIVKNSYASGSVINYGNGGLIAGLVSYNGGEISSSFASGSIRATRGSGGGLVGINFRDTQQNYYGQIINSYATGGLKCTGSYEGAGGLAFQNSSVITRSYSIGKVDGERYQGGFVAYEDTPGSMAKDYWDTNTSGTDTGVGQGSAVGLTGLTTQQFRSNLPPGFSKKIWAEDPNTNKGYPYLIANPPPK